ncbi:hypothetical protein [Celeribacter sp.]|uniref:hypothetical protein n=1 Tax=Celeribacter sp. TaxID=1890673 RepID=UPI003A92C5A5
MLLLREVAGFGNASGGDIFATGEGGGNGLLMSWRYFEGAEQAGTPMAATGEGALPVAAEVARSSA